MNEYLRNQTKNKVWVHHYQMYLLGGYNYHFARDYEVHEAKKNTIKLRIPGFKANVKHQKQ